MRVRTEGKRLAILAIAGRMFLQQGYAAVTMASVAAAVGGSKTTLYGYFPSKEELFAAFVTEAGRSHYDDLAHISLMEAGVEATLNALGRSYLQLLFSPDVFAINRLVISEVPRFPELGAIYYENGPKRLMDRMSDLLAEAATAGLVRIPAPRTAALHFTALCDTGLYDRMLWGVEMVISEETMNRSVQLATEVFLDHYK